MRMSDSGTKPIILNENGTVSQISGQIGNQSTFDDHDRYFNNNFIQPETYSKWSVSFHVSRKFGNSQVGYILYLSTSTSNVLRIYINSSNLVINYGAWTSLITYSVSNNTNNFFTFTYDGSNIILYKDLTQVGSYSISNKTVSYTTSDPVKIGADSTYSTFQDYLKIDDVKMWDYNLSQSERENEYYLFKEQKKSL